MSRRSFVFLGLSITSSWGNGHAVTYRALLSALHRRGHRVTFLERDVPWYAANRDLPRPPYASVHLYGSLEELRDTWTDTIRHADCVVVGSYVPDGVAVGDWVLERARGIRAFYDIDTPVTLERLAADRPTYIARRQVPRYDLLLSFTGGPTLDRLQQDFGARMARPLHCSVDPDLYRPVEGVPEAWDLGYLGTWSADRQPGLARLLLEPAERLPDRRFVVAGPQYPEEIRWPGNVQRIEHLPPASHPRFYAAQRYTLNLTRAAMAAVGWSPSIRLFEAAACGTPIISDSWEGIGAFLEPGREILLVADAVEVAAALEVVPEEERRALGAAARARVLLEHTPDHRAEDLLRYVASLARHRGLPGGHQAAG